MLPKPKILKLPAQIGSYNINGSSACAPYSQTGCRVNYHCTPYGNECVDSTYDEPCGGWFGAGAAVASVGVGVVVGIGITMT